MRVVSASLLAASALAVLPPVARGQRETKEVGAQVSLMPRGARQRHNVVLPFRIETRPVWAIGEPVTARVSWTMRSLAELPARRSWTATHTGLAGAFTVALLLDAAQTRDLARRGWPGYREWNPLLGSQPGVGRVDTYTALAGLSVLTAAAAAPKRVRPWLLGAAFAVEALTVYGSARQGLPVRFP